MRKRLVVALLASCMVGGGAVGNSALAMSPSQFVDVEKNNELFKYVERVFDAGIMEGKEDDEFGLEEKMTRGDVIDALWKLADKPEQDYSSKFEDAKNVDSVTMAEDKELFKGLPEDFFTDGKFEADKELTREQFAAIFYNYAEEDGIIEMNTEAVKDETILDAFDDKDTVDEYAVKAMKWNVGYTFLERVENEADVTKNELKADETITKGQVAEAIAKYMEEVDKVESERYEAEMGQGTVVKPNKGNGATTGKVEAQKPAEEGTATGEAQKPSVDEGKDDTQESEEQKPEEHVHKFIPKYEWVTVDAQEGYYDTKLVKDAYDEVIKHEEEGHYEDKLVKPAYDETVHHDAVYEDKWVVDKEAWEETVHHDAVTEQKWVVDKEAVYEDKWVVDKEAWEETVHHDAVTEQKWVVDKEAWEETIHHEAVTEQKWVVDKPAWDEVVPEKGEWQTVVVKPAWDEPVYETHVRVICKEPSCQADMTDWSEGELDAHLKKHIMNGEVSGYAEKEVQVQVDTIHHDAVTENKWVIITPEHTVHHDEEGHYETVVVTPAWDEVVKHPEEGHYETVVVTPAWDEVIKHEEEGHWEKVKVSDEEGHYETVVVTPAWDEVVKHPEEGHYEKVLVTPAWDETVHHEAEYEKVWVVDKEAWEETIHHEAEYETVWVDPVPEMKEWTLVGFECSGCKWVVGGPKVTK